jgi:CRP-like cAMP-binding protein
MPPILKKAIRKARVKRYPRGQIMLYKEDGLQDILILKRGVAKMHDFDQQDNEKILHLLKPWAVIPFAFFSGSGSRINWFYSALTECEVWVMPVEELQALFQTNSELATCLTNWFSREVHELLVRVSSFGKTTTNDRIRAALKFLAVYHATPRAGGWCRVNFPVNNRFLADVTGITRESAAMIMKEFASLGWVRKPRLAILEINLHKLSG